jgi:phosphoribosylformimino-5-aminoimidazole carboxamide ribotide isomerase
MEVVPVIDLKGGAVVRARLGDRAAYRPIETPLSPTSDPLDVVAGLISVHPFRTLYVADLDAIEGKGDAGAIRRPPVPPRSQTMGEEPSPPPTSLVLGSESQRDCGLLRALRDHPHVILSLDFRGDRFLGPDCLLSEPDLWPQRLIVMTLARVGSGAGPDLDRHAAIRERAGGRLIYLAGGLRDRRDLAAVKASGAAGILVASALHDGRISAADLTSA